MNPYNNQPARNVVYNNQQAPPFQYSYNMREPARPAPVNELKCFPESMIECNERLALFIFIVNIFFGVTGTFISACIDRKGFNNKALLVGLA